MSARVQGERSELPAGKDESVSSDMSLEEAWKACGKAFYRGVEAQFVRKSGSVEAEILFCLLGGFGITYEHNVSALEVLAPLDPFGDSWDDDELFEAIAEELSVPQFDPPKRDGTPRRFRFPRRKATLIVLARRWVITNGPVEWWLERLSSARERRDYLCDCPGIGRKTASWLLRNLGWGDELAILDVHLLRALGEAGRMPDDVKLPRDYERVEEAFLQWCSDLDAPPGVFDLFAWEWQRGTLVMR